jgi:hypothetical protein
LITDPIISLLGLDPRAIAVAKGIDNRARAVLIAA